MKHRMQKFIRILLAALLIAALTAPPALAAETAPDYDFSSQTLEEIMADFIAERRLTEDNFAMGWYDISTGESYYFNEDGWFVAASMYKLPLAMVCYDRIAEGTLSLSDSAGGGWRVDRALNRAIVCSDNDAAEALRHVVSYSQTAYRYAISVYSGMTKEELPRGYYYDNHMSPRFLIGTLQTLWDRSAEFETLITDLKSASPKMCFGSVENRRYEMGHKYGAYEGAVNDCAIVWAPQPYLLVVFTQSARYAERTLREIYSLFEDYAAYREAQRLTEAAAAKAAAVRAEAEQAAAEQAARAAEELRLAKEAAAKAAEEAAAEQAAQEAAAEAAAQAARARRIRILIRCGIGAAALAAFVIFVYVVIFLPDRRRKAAYAAALAARHGKRSGKKQGKRRR